MVSNSSQRIVLELPPDTAFLPATVAATENACKVFGLDGGKTLRLALAVPAVLLDHDNPQSFHWSMPLVAPAAPLAALAAAVMAAGVLTGAWTARAAAAAPAVQSVREDT